jgi:hypothetical protein
MERDKRKEDSSVREGEKKRSEVLVEPSKLRALRACFPFPKKGDRGRSMAKIYRLTTR